MLLPIVKVPRFSSTFSRENEFDRLLRLEERAPPIAPNRRGGGIRWVERGRDGSKGMWMLGC